ncbi:MAG TPA: hypothetical protein PK400_03010 [Phycisphaerales bacterium]|nr:hypothetical protein [Phycisphaerales bacterium]HRQ75208.1 hypothetical protein [Phycisphaerales bacterium]
MQSIDPKRSLTVLAVFLAPVAVVKVTAMWIGAANPNQAVAYVEPAAEAPLAIPHGSSAAKSSPEQERVADYLQVLRNSPFGPSPFYVEPRQLERPAPPAVPQAEVPIVETAEGLNVVVRAVMASRDGNIALINGKPMRVGDVLGEGWRIAAINSEAATVTFEHHDGRSETRSVR